MKDLMIELGAGDLQAVTSVHVAMESVEQESEMKVADLETIVCVAVESAKIDLGMGLVDLETVVCVAMVELAEIDLEMGLADLETEACMTVELTEIDFETETAN